MGQTKLKRKQFYDDGWIPSGETWTYASADDPTYTFTISAFDATAKYSVGMKVKLTQSTGGTKFAIITKVVFDDPGSTITCYFGTDYNLENEAVTAPYYSMLKAPFGFPLEPTKWTVQGGTSSSQTTPTVNTWYNVGGSVVMPIGAWKVDFMYQPNTKTSGSGQTDMFITLSTANNTVGIAPWNNEVYVNPHQAENYGYPSMRTGFLSLSTKTTYYANAKWQWGGVTTYIGLRFVVIRAVCAYL